MKSQLLSLLVLYSTLTACGADQGAAPMTLTAPTVTPTAEVEPEATVEVKADKKASTETMEPMIESAPTETPDPVEPKAAKLLAESCIDPDLSEVLAGTQLMLCDGTIAAGTLVIPAAPDLTNLTASNVKSGVTIAGVTGTLTEESHALCNTNGQTGCVTGVTYKSADISSLSASNVKLGVTIAGVEGTLVTESHSSCSTDNQTGCIANDSYKAVDTTNIVAANLKNGVSIAGVTGTYPSAAAPLATATATDDLTAALFNIKIKSDDQFEYFDSTGARHTQTGNSELKAENIKADVSLFNVSGTLEPASEVTIDPWDLRYGKTVNGVAGKLKTICRTHDTNGTVPAAETCAENANWQDLTSLSSASATTCAADPSNCMFKDRLSGLYVSKDMGTATKTAAMSGCVNLVYGGFDDWRLPSTEEAMALASHGAGENTTIYSYANWTTTTYSSPAVSYITVMEGGVATQKTATDSSAYFCVRK